MANSNNNHSRFPSSASIFLLFLFFLPRRTELIFNCLGYIFSHQSQTSPFNMATVGNHNKSVAQPSSAMANYANNHLASVTDSEDHDDTGGGVNLRDFDEHGNNISALRATPSRNGGAPLHGYGNMNASSTPVSNPASSSRRNTIAPIGAGRFSEYTPTVDAIDATIEAIV
jgi:hypothetical protein